MAKSCCIAKEYNLGHSDYCSNSDYYKKQSKEQQNYLDKTCETSPITFAEERAKKEAECNPFAPLDWKFAGATKVEQNAMLDKLLKKIMTPKP